MKRIILISLLAVLLPLCSNARTLVVYYSFTNHTNSVVTDLLTQIEADVVRIQPAEKGLDYAANNYAIGSRLISAIRNNRNDASSYPASDATDINFNDYSTIIIGTPLWWGDMSAIMQSFLFQYGSQMAGKQILLIVSSQSSGISGVESDAKRLVPEGNFVSSSLWVRASQVSNCHSMIASWLSQINYTTLDVSLPTMADAGLTLHGHHLSATAADKLQVYDLSGRLLVEANSHTVQIPEAFKGVGMARIFMGNRERTVKIKL